MNTQNLPTLSRGNATQCTFGLQPNTQTFESPLNKTIQTYELPGARWLFTATWQNLNQLDARAFKAWLAILRGAAGRFYASDLSHKAPSGHATGSGLVYGASQTGNSIVTVWAGVPNQTGWLLSGDYVGIGGELKIVSASIPITSGNHATIVFEPPMRAVPTDASVIVINNPAATFRLNDDKQDIANIDPDRHPTITIAATEVF
jgi:hypothetical protein